MKANLLCFLSASIMFQICFTFHINLSGSANDMPNLFNCSAIYPFQKNHIASLIQNSSSTYPKNYVEQASFIKKGLQEQFAGGTWAVVIVSNVSAKSLDEISNFVLGHRPFKIDNVCVFWYGVNTHDPLVLYYIEKISLINFPESKFSTSNSQSYSSFFTYQNIVDIKNAANKCCAASKNLDDFSLSFIEELSKIVSSGSWKVIASVTQYNGFSPAAVGSVFMYWFYGEMPKHCSVNGKVINIIFYSD